MFLMLTIAGFVIQITSIQGDQVVLIGHRRIRISELVSRNFLPHGQFLCFGISVLLLYAFWCIGGGTF